jgi:imidazolonepropionase-like amidohydrolase
MTITHTTSMPSSAPSARSPFPLRSSFTALAMAALTMTSAAQDLTIKAPPQSHPIAIINAAIHPVSSPTLQHGYITFDRGRITAVGEGTFEPPPGTRIIDAAGMHVYPGFIGPNTQIGLAEITAVRASNDHREVGDITPEVRAAVAVNPDSTLLPVTRTNGVLTVGVFPTGGRIPGRASVMQLEGWTWEEMAVKQDAGLTINWPSARPVTAWWMDRTESEQAEDARRQHAAIDEAFDAATDYLRARAADPSHPVDLRWEAMRGVLNHAGSDGGEGDQLPVFIAANELDQIVAAATWGVQRNLNVVIVGGRDAPMAADLLKRHDIPVMINGIHTFPKRADSPYDDAFTVPARLHEAGVRFCIASADRTAHERNLPYNAATAVAYGLDRSEAIRSITLSAAEILGVADELGSLEPGKRATFIITGGDPLEIVTNVEMAFIEGRQIDLGNKQSALAEKYRERYRQQREAEDAAR